MSTRRLAIIAAVPPIIKRIFNRAAEPICNEERLWRERAARMTLDALGYTNLTVKPKLHNEAVRYSRLWFRRMFDHHPDPKRVDNVVATFDSAGVNDFPLICNAVLAVTPFLFQNLSEDDDDDDDEPKIQD